MTVVKIAAKAVPAQMAARLQAKLVDRAPAWLAATTKVPPAASTLRRTTRLAQVVPHSYEVSTQERQQQREQQSASDKNIKLRRYSNKQLKYKGFTVPKIVYPEDELRVHFYKEHPYELLRIPKSMVEEGIPEPAFDIRKLAARDQHLTDAQRGMLGLPPRASSSSSANAATTTAEMTPRVTGEDVIQYQMWLMSRKVAGLTRHQAYARAIAVFNEIRWREDAEERLAIDQARAFDLHYAQSDISSTLNAVVNAETTDDLAKIKMPSPIKNVIPLRPDTEKGIACETAALIASQDVIVRRLEYRKMASTTSEKSFAEMGEAEAETEA